MSLTADQKVASSIPAWFHTFVEINHEILSMIGLIIQEGLLSVTSESMCMEYWLAACSSLTRKSVIRCTDSPAMAIAVDFGRNATKKTDKTNKAVRFSRNIIPFLKTLDLFREICRLQS